MSKDFVHVLEVNQAETVSMIEADRPGVLSWACFWAVLLVVLPRERPERIELVSSVSTWAAREAGRNAATEDDAAPDGEKGEKVDAGSAPGEGNAGAAAWDV